MREVTMASGADVLKSRKSPRLLMVQPEPKRRAELAQVLRSVSPDVHAHPSLGALDGPVSYDLLLVDYDSLSPAERQQLVQRYLQAQRPTPLLVLSGGECRSDFVDLFGSRTLTNLLGREEPLCPEDVIVTVQKLLRGDIFGLEKYFTWGVEPLVMKIRSSKEKAQVLKVVGEVASDLGVHSRLTEQFRNVADEFVSNAVYNAPVDSAGQSRYASTPREVEVSLQEHEEITVKLCSNGHRLGISVTDPFGSLTKDRLLSYLAKCFRRDENQVDTKPGGSGLGLYSVFEALSHFVVNIHPKRQTEMIGLLDIRGSYRDFARRNKSFNVFICD